MSPTVDTRIRSLSPQIDATIRTELQAHLSSLRDHHNAVGVLLGMSRLCLLLVRRVYETLGEPVPSDNLYACWARLSTGDPALKITGLKVLPKEIDTRTHVVRILSNMVDHAVESSPPTEEDADEALMLYLRLLKWYYVEFPRGPRLASIDKEPGLGAAGTLLSRLASSRRLVYGALTGAALLLAVGGGVWLVTHPPHPTTGPAGTAPSQPPPANRPLDELLERGPLPTSGGVAPRLGLDLLKWQPATRSFVELRDGESLQSGVDQYAIVVRPGTPGHLYVFQIDGRGSVNWYFPKNDFSTSSIGSNPVEGNVPVMIPPAERRTGLYLDDTTGTEQVFAVMTAAPWPELEASLAEAGRLGSRFDVAGRNRGSAGERTLEKPAEISWDGKMIRLGDKGLQADGAYLQVVRWFRHDPPRQG